MQFPVIASLVGLWFVVVLVAGAPFVEHKVSAENKPFCAYQIKTHDASPVMADVVKYASLVFDCFCHVLHEDSTFSERSLPSKRNLLSRECFTFWFLSVVHVETRVLDQERAKRGLEAQLVEAAKKRVVDAGDVALNRVRMGW